VARADISHKQSLVKAALRELDRARALAELSRVTAPFDGTVVERRIDLGSFVQNATSGQSEPLVSVARTDIMTVVMKVPDTFAPLVMPQTEVILQLDELAGVYIHGAVTRFTPSIQGSDRSMRVEVDLFNGTTAEYARFVGRGLGTYLAPLGGAGAPGVAALSAAAQAVWAPNRKGPNDPFPLYPRVSGQGEGYGTRRMLPGMVGTMRLLLRRFDNSYLLPSGAVFSRGGKRYLACVKDGKVELVPVRVQVDDGTLAKVAVIARPANLKVGQVELLQDLTGNEEVLLTGQGEVSPGQPVRTTPVEW
jgi:multidrug efflux pump subunit AcrA (membrane-fusion protein)